MSHENVPLRSSLKAPTNTVWMDKYAVSDRKGAVLAHIPQIAQPPKQRKFVGHRPLSARHPRCRSPPTAAPPDSARSSAGPSATSRSRPSTATQRTATVRHCPPPAAAAVSSSSSEVYSREAVESLVRRLTNNFGRLLQAQRCASERLIHKLMDEYEDRLRECTCARTTRRQQLAERSHQAMNNALRSFEENDQLVTQGIALTDAGIQQLLQELPQCRVIPTEEKIIMEVAAEEEDVVKPPNVVITAPCTAAEGSTS